MKWIASLTLGAVCVIALTFGVVTGSSAPSRTFINDFENPGDDTPAGDWTTGPPATSTRTPSGAPATYGSGIQSASGSWHVRLRHNSVCPKVQASFACSGPFTRWGKPTGFNPDFPDGGYVTEISIYLDVPWMTMDPTRFDTRFDWSSAINNSAGVHRADLVFNAGTPLSPAETAASPGYYVNASTNAFRSGAFPQNPCPAPSAPPNSCRTPVKITDTGWYVFQHFFHLVTIGGTDYVQVDMSIRRLNGAVVKSWTIYIPDNGTGFGGDRYGWLVIQEIDDLAADCVVLRPPGRTPAGRTCPQGVPSQATGGGQINVVGGRGTFGFNVRSDDGGTSGHLNYRKTGVHLNCEVTVVTELTTTSAKFSGTCSPNSSATSFTAEVEDNDEPGAGTDHFKITYNAMTEGNTIARGNVQIR
jgi:hypothetical protein